MGKTLEIDKNLGLLKKYSAELGFMIEDGSFYRLSFSQRFKLIRRVKKLYNRLLGPVSALKLKHMVAAAGVLALNTACFIPVGLAPDLRTGGTIDPGAFSGGAGSIDLTPYFTWRGVNPYGIVPLGHFRQAWTEHGVEISYAEGAGSAFVDIDGDGDLDLIHSRSRVTGTYDFYTETVTQSFGGAELLVQENIGTPQSPMFAPPVALSVDMVPHVGGLAFADMDNDGDLDLWIATRSHVAGFGRMGSYVEADGLAFFENTGSRFSPMFEFRGTYSGYVEIAPWDRIDVAVGDLDGDGDLDLLVGLSNGVVAIENTGSAEEPSFDFYSLDEDAFGIGSYGRYTEYGFGIVLVDVDGDGDKDLVGWGDWYGGFYNQGVVIINNGDSATPNFNQVIGQYELGFYLEGYDPYYMSYPNAVDIDADGDLDVFVSDRRVYGGPVEGGMYVEGYYFGGLLFFENLVVDSE